jgi:hypothetical protein
MDHLGLNCRGLTKYKQVVKMTISGFLPVWSFMYVFGAARHRYHLDQEV